MNTNIQCCESFSIRKCDCTCGDFCSNKKDTEELWYANKEKQILITDAPRIDFKDFVLISDLDRTEIVSYVFNEAGEIIIVSLQGAIMYHDDNVLKKPIIGKPLKEVLPDYMVKFLLPTYHQTLNGVYLQFLFTWKGLSYLYRTIPIRDYKKVNYAGITIISPFINELNGDINRFSINRHNENRLAKPERPDKQQMSTNEPNTLDDSSSTEITQNGSIL